MKKASERPLPPLWREFATGFSDFLDEVNRSPNTLRTYRVAVDQLGHYLEDNGLATDPRKVTRADLGAWMRHLQRPMDEGGQGLEAQTCLQRYRSVSRFFWWMVKEEEIERSPMEKMSPPMVPEKMVPIVAEESMKKLFKTVSGSDFEGRRDKAILSVFIDVGLRVGEMAGLTVPALDMDDRTLTVMGKGRRARVVRFTTMTRTDLRRYLRKRAEHPASVGSEALWIGRVGPLTGSGIYRMVARRAKEAGIDHIHPHQLRHTFAHLYLASGGTEGNLMSVTGWKSRSMVDRYGKSVAAQRALDAHDVHSPRQGL